MGEVGETLAAYSLRHVDDLIGRGILKIDASGGRSTSQSRAEN